ncbi:8749_t:CDS:1, partial [Racocetra persica]
YSMNIIPILDIDAEHSELDNIGNGINNEPSSYKELDIDAEHSELDNFGNGICDTNNEPSSYKENAPDVVEDTENDSGDGENPMYPITTGMDFTNFTELDR